MVAMFIFNGLASRRSSNFGLFLINVTMPLVQKFLLDSHVMILPFASS